MTNYRPITDMWILARAKLKDGKKFYGAYPGGFLERARVLIGCTMQQRVLHVCAGRVKEYPYGRGYSEYWDSTLDMDPELEPDFLRDASRRFPRPEAAAGMESLRVKCWDGILIDPPYTEKDADKYAPGAAAFPKVNVLLKNGLRAVKRGGKVGILHYIVPAPPKKGTVGYEVKFVAAVGVLVGFNNRIRVFSVFERVAPEV